MKKQVLNIIRKVAGTAKLQKDVKKLRSDVVESRYETRRYQLVEHILHDTESGVTSQKYTDHDIIVSLTTYGKRIHDVAFTIESIMQQSMKPNRIILWLDYSFQNKQLPQSLLNQQKRGLEIAFCEDLRSYKKLIPALHKYPHEAIVTFDDDLLYDYDILEHLITSYLEAPQCIHSCRGRQMLYDQEHQLLPYIKWKLTDSEPGVIDDYFLTGGAGTLYPPCSLDVEVLNQDVFMEICPLADDVWFNAMARKKGTVIKKAFTRNSQGDDFLVNESMQDVALYKINQKGKMLNDSQIKAVFTKYNLYEII